MSGDYSKDYTVKPVAYSGGASGLDSMTHWTHIQLPTSVPGRSVWAAEGEGDKGSIHVVFYLDATTGRIPDAPFPSERLLCHVLLAQLPDVAIGDALECLTDVWSDAQPRQMIASLAPPRAGTGRVVATRQPDPILVAEG